jgi:hypothetical protein
MKYCLLALQDVVWAHQVASSHSVSDVTLLLVMT